VCRAFGPVQHGWPQTAHVGEWLGFHAVAELAVEEVQVHQDCMGVTNEFAKTRRAQLRRTNRAADIALSAWQLPGWRHIRSVSLVKGHATMADVQHDAEKVALRQGNNSADEAAKLGLDLHPMPSQELATRVDKQLKTVNQVAKLAWRCCPCSAGSTARS
jgi:hypothetical protein